MSIFVKFLDMFKLDSTRKIEYTQKIISGEIIPDGQTIYFKNGKMYKVYPSDEEKWYDAKYLVSDGILYNLENAEDLKRIPIPNFSTPNSFEGYGITGSLEYVLKMKAAHLRQKGNIAESDSIYERIHLFLGSSDNGYREKDYFVYPLTLLGEFQFEKAEKVKLEIEKYLTSLKVGNGMFSFYNTQYDMMNKLLNDCKKYRTDFIEMSAHCACCEECNKLQGRVYSISGKSKIFPKLPSNIKKTGKVHEGCRHSFTAYFFYNDGEDTIHDKFGNNVDVIVASQRAYKDDRTEQEKQDYEEYINRRNNEKNWWNNEVERYRKRYDSKLEYDQICQLLPSLSPKTLTGYLRMKTSKTKNFMKIVEEAKKKGIEIKLD